MKYVVSGETFPLRYHAAPKEGMTEEAALNDFMITFIPSGIEPNDIRRFAKNVEGLVLGRITFSPELIGRCICNATIGLPNMVKDTSSELGEAIGEKADGGVIALKSLGRPFHCQIIIRFYPNARLLKEFAASETEKNWLWCDEM